MRIIKYPTYTKHLKREEKYKEQVEARASTIGLVQNEIDQVFIVAKGLAVTQPDHWYDIANWLLDAVQAGTPIHHIKNAWYEEGGLDGR